MVGVSGLVLSAGRVKKRSRGHCDWEWKELEDVETKVSSSMVSVSPCEYAIMFEIDYGLKPGSPWAVGDSVSTRLNPFHLRF